MAQARPPAAGRPGPLTRPTERYALATASYAGDFARCALLCASIDRFVTGWDRHYILVDEIDLRRFAPLAGPRRTIICERELLPSWLRSWPDPLSLGRRRVWTGPGALARAIPPLRGWHAQQLRKLGLSAVAGEDIYLHADSDLIFVRPYDLASLARQGKTRLYARPGGIDGTMSEHVEWARNAARLLGLPAPDLPCTDYVNNLVSWRREHLVGLLRHIEATTGRDWVSAVAATRRFSEYLLYGFYVDHVLGAASGHMRDTRPLAHTYWGKDDVPPGGLDDLVASLTAGQVAVGVQSFIGAPLDHLKAQFEKL